MQWQHVANGLNCRRPYKRNSPTRAPPIGPAVTTQSEKRRLGRNSAELYWVWHPETGTFFFSFFFCDLVWLVDGPSGAKECCCCMLICHQHRFRWPPKIWAQGLPPYLYLSIVYESQAWVLSDFHPKAWCSRSGSRFEVWLYTEWLCDL